MPDRLATAAPTAPARGFDAADYTVWVADSDRAASADLVALLARAGFRTRAFQSGEAVLDALAALPRRACVLAEVELPGITGLELAARLRQRGVAAPVLLLTRLGDVATAVRAMRGNVSDYLVKPWVERDLVERLRHALQASPGALH